eukprot:1380815-Pyramimonas_sp.AAC.1
MAGLVTNFTCLRRQPKFWAWGKAQEALRPGGEGWSCHVLVHIEGGIERVEGKGGYILMMDQSDAGSV